MAVGGHHYDSAIAYLIETNPGKLVQRIDGSGSNKRARNLLAV
jgi:hypothetical protein